MAPTCSTCCKPKERVETQAYMYSSLNVGFTLGAAIGGIALATGSLTVVRFTPFFAAALMLANAFWVTRLPAAPHDLRVASGEQRVRPPGPSAGRNVGWILVNFITGVLWTNQVLLNIVIPLWLVEATDAPHVLLAWLFGTNTVLCIFLPAYTSKGVRNLGDALRYTWISTGVLRRLVPDHDGHPLDRRPDHRAPGLARPRHRDRRRARDLRRQLVVPGRADGPAPTR